MVEIINDKNVSYTLQFSRLCFYIYELNEGFITVYKQKSTETTPMLCGKHNGNNDERKKKEKPLIKHYLISFFVFS